MNTINATLGRSSAYLGGESKAWEYSKREGELERRLLAAGINAKTLADDYGVVLWAIRHKDDGVRLTLDVRKKVNPNLVQLKALFEQALGLPVELKLKSLDKCCGSMCKGCLAGNPDKRKDWID